MKGFPPEAPTHWKLLRIGRPYTLEAPTHWKALRIGSPAHRKPLRIGSPCALEASTHWKALPFKKYFIYIYNAPAKLKGDRENSCVARQNISSAKATV